MNLRCHRRPRAFGSRVTCASVLCLVLAPLSLESEQAETARSARATERIAVNDNRTYAGAHTAGALTINLDARRGMWHPDRDSDPGTEVKAFAVAGGPLQIPGPAIRVREGTTITARVRNALDEDLVLHGFYTRPGKAAGAEPAVTVPAGQTKEIAFLAGRPGTYYYWGATVSETTIADRGARDSQLVGAFIVDPREGPRGDDRILLISNLLPNQPASGAVGRMVINGKSWPHTERLAYTVGDAVRLRLINAGSAVHPMHLHGFYFNVDSRGDEGVDTVFAPGSTPRMVVTERMPPGRTFSMTWKPTRPGNWLFHCHDNIHLRPGTPLSGGAAPTGHHHVENHALEMMAGPVLGITVTGKSTEPAPATAPRRQLTLVARVAQGSTDIEPAFGYTLHSGSNIVAPSTTLLPGPTIVLKRGEPVSITVKNELPEPTAVHWHGIELESYYDGVAGYSGEGKRITPAIPTGGSFDARFTPPRSGTFIYHTHVDEVRQQQAGLSGALLVVDDPATFNPERDIVMLITIPRSNTEAATTVLLNGSSKPALREMRAGEHYRLRFINVHTARPSMRMRLLRETSLLEWRALAKDGIDLPADQAITGPSEIQMGNGETYDFDFVPAAAGDLRIDITNNVGVLLVSMPIRVR